MTRDRKARRTPIIISFLIGLMLTIMPLPLSLEVFRPDWIALLIIYWAVQLPRTWNVGSAWVIGLVLDVAQGTLLGQHALALSVIAYITVRFHLQLRVFPMLQLTVTVFALLAMYQFLLFWINGVANNDAAAVTYWGPVMVGAAVWPLVHLLLSGIRYRTRSGN